MHTSYITFYLILQEQRDLIARSSLEFVQVLGRLLAGIFATRCDSLMWLLLEDNEISGLFQCLKPCSNVIELGSI